MRALTLRKTIVQRGKPCVVRIEKRAIPAPVRKAPVNSGLVASAPASVETLRRLGPIASEVAHALRDAPLRMPGRWWRPQ